MSCCLQHTSCMIRSFHQGYRSTSGSFLLCHLPLGHFQTPCHRLLDSNLFSYLRRCQATVHRLRPSSCNRTPHLTQLLCSQLLYHLSQSRRHLGICFLFPICSCPA